MNKKRTRRKWRGKFGRKHDNGVKNPDSSVIFQIKKHLRRKYHIPFKQIKTEHAIKPTKKGCIVLPPPPKHKKSQIRRPFHTPDVIITDKNDDPKVIIEQDGRIHESKTHSEKDKVRNGHYARMGIPYIILNSKKIKSTGMTPAAYLDNLLKKLDIFSVIVPDRAKIETSLPHGGKPQ